MKLRSLTLILRGILLGIIPVIFAGIGVIVSAVLGVTMGLLTFVLVLLPACAASVIKLVDKFVNSSAALVSQNVSEVSVPEPRSA